MRITCIGRYRSSAGSYDPGQAVDVSDEMAEFLLRDSPTSFQRIEDASSDAPAEAVVGDSAAEPDLSAMSTETATGFTAPDRRARGGSKRA